MSPQELIFRAARGRPPEPVGQETCAICGATGAAPYEFSSKFMNWDVVKGDSLCEACAFCTKEEALRRNSFIATLSEITFIPKEKIAEWLFSPPEPPFVFCVTRSKKKHNAIRARLNLSKKSFFVRMEELEVIFEPTHLRPAFDAILELLEGGFSKREIASRQVKAKKLFAFGLERWLELSAIIEPLSATPELELLLFAARKEDKDDGEGSP